MSEDGCAVAECSRPRRKRQWCQPHYQRFRRWGDPLGGQSEKHRYDSHQERFWAKVDKSAGPDGCWPWTASTSTGGYGQFMWLEVRSGPLIASRVALFFTTGIWPEVALHTCDNPPCCNPAHLRDTTQRENRDDAVRKGRAVVWTPQRAEPLDADDVRAIRAAVAGGKSQAAVARAFNVNQSTVSLIVNRKTWKDVR